MNNSSSSSSFFTLTNLSIGLAGISGIAVPLFLWRNRAVAVQDGLPGPPRAPILGMLLFAMQNWENWPIVAAGLSKKFQHATWGGPAFFYGALFYTDDPINVKHILKDNFLNYEKSSLFHSVYRELLGNGIFSADGPTWESHRKISVRLFSRNLLRYACRAIDRNCKVIIEHLNDAIIASDSSNVGQTTTTSVDLQDLFFRFTIDNTAETVFGIKVNSLLSKRQPLFTKAFDELQYLCSQRFVDPLFELKRFFRCTTRERRIRQLQRTLHEYCAGVIAEKRRTVVVADDDTTTTTTEQQHMRSNDDLLSLFVQYSKNSTDDELRDVIMNFTVAGRDTTAAALSWTFFELSKHPEVVEKVVAEALEVFGPPSSSDSANTYTYDGLMKLKYTHCVVMEALRLHPSVPLDSKFAVKKDVWPDGTVIPARAGVSYHILAMGLNEQIYGNDVKEFKPERFMDQKEPSQYSFTAFNAGPRLCIGKPLALLTMKMALVQLLPRFNFTDKIGHTDEMKWLLVGKMKHGFTVEVTPRSL